MTNPVAIDRAHGGAAPEGVIDFSISINPLGPPSAAKAAYERAWSRVHSYPPAKSGALEERLATWLRVPAENLLAGNGTTQLIYLLARVLGPGLGLEVVSHVSNIPKGSRLAVSTTLLASIIALGMRATGQARALTGPLSEDDIDQTIMPLVAKLQK